jgi:hypothetical protein
VKTAPLPKVDAKAALARFGLSGETLAEAKGKEMHLRVTKGVVVTDVQKGFFKDPAPKVGDVLARIGEVRPQDVEQAALLLARVKPGQSVPLVFLRQQEKNVFRYDVNISVGK